MLREIDPEAEIGLHNQTDESGWGNDAETLFSGVGDKVDRLCLQVHPNDAVELVERWRDVAKIDVVEFEPWQVGVPPNGQDRAEWRELYSELYRAGARTIQIYTPEDTATDYDFENWWETWADLREVRDEVLADTRGTVLGFGPLGVDLNQDGVVDVADLYAKELTF